MLKCLGMQESRWVYLQAAASKPSESTFAAKLCFAHAETIVPLLCLLGLVGGPPAVDSSKAGSVGQRGVADVQSQVSCEPQPPAVKSKAELNQCSSTDSRSSGESVRSSNSDSGSSSSSSMHCDSSIGSSPMVCVQGGDNEGQGWVPPLPRPPLSRGWYGSRIAPYGANIQFVLHRRTDTQVGLRCYLCLKALVANLCVGRGGTHRCGNWCGDLSLAC